MKTEKDTESGMYNRYSTKRAGAHTQAKTPDKLNENLKEVIELCQGNMTKKEIDAPPKFN